MSIPFYCRHCGEMLTEDQAGCPFCMNPATPLDECVSVVAAWHERDCEWHHEQAANECTCPTIGQRMQAEEITRLRQENASLNAALAETHRSFVSALAAAARQGGDVKQAPAESPQSGHEVATPNPSHIPLMNKDTNRADR